MVSDSLLAIGCSLTCSILWAIGYLFLNTAIKSLNQFSIDFIYGISITLVNLFIIIFYSGFENLFLLGNNNKIFLQVLIYVSCFILSSNIYLYGYSRASKSISVSAYVSISSCYPLFLFIFTYLYSSSSQEPKNINWFTTGFAILFILIGIILLSLSTK